MAIFFRPFVLLNFAHPLTDAQKDQIVALTGQVIERLIEVPSQIDVQKPLLPQIVVMANATGLQHWEWKSYDFVVNLPSLNFSAAAMLAELHGRMGYFPPVLRLRPVAGATPPRYEVAEILDLWAQADAAKYRR